jgi:hypothetical protein
MNRQTSVKLIIRYESKDNPNYKSNQFNLTKLGLLKSVRLLDFSKFDFGGDLAELAWLVPLNTLEEIRFGHRFKLTGLWNSPEAIQRLKTSIRKATIEVTKIQFAWGGSSIDGIEYSDGSRYKGGIKDMPGVTGTIHVPHGVGIMKWPTGDSYVGGWLNGRHNGDGTYLWANGAQYIGEWTNGQMHGKGMFISADGNVSEGQFTSGKFAD